MKLKFIITIATVFVLAGCATWVNLDDSKADQDKINTAKSRCNHDSTLLKLQSSEVAKDAKVLATSNVAEKRELEEAYLREEKEVYRKLNACMRKQGLKPLI